MSKFIIGKTVSFALEGKYRGILLDMDLPMSYTLYDMMQIIKMYANYTDKYEWKFINPYDENKALSSIMDNEKLDKIKFDEYRDVTPAINCFYGNLNISIGARGHLKYKKVFPTIYQAVGNFPSEENLINDAQIEKDKKWTKEGLKDFDDKLKTYFKSKYNITDEVVASFFGDQNDLARK